MDEAPSGIALTIPPMQRHNRSPEVYIDAVSRRFILLMRRFFVARGLSPRKTSPRTPARTP